MRLLAITDIAFWQKISGTERLGEAKGEAARMGGQKGMIVELNGSCLPSATRGVIVMMGGDAEMTELVVLMPSPKNTG